VAITDARSGEASGSPLTFRFIASRAPSDGEMMPAARVSKVCGISRTTGVMTRRKDGAPHSRPEAMMIEQALVSTPMRTHP
jgi:hypothetical protein